MRSATEIDLRIHPPPDIVLEIEIASGSLDKLPLYAAVGVPEVWRYNGAEMEFRILVGDGYQGTSHSMAFPHLTAERLNHYLIVGGSRGSAAMLELVKSDLVK